MTDYAGAIAMYVDPAITFDTNNPKWIVVHKTAGFTTAQDCAAYFQRGSDGRNVSSHYIVGMDGTVIQCVPESRGAGANCCVENGHAAYLPTGVNLNTCTISIEHIDPAPDNSTPVPPAQAAASFALIADICQRTGIPFQAGGGAGGIIGHHDIAPVTRARCPGNYPWPALYMEKTMIPSGWTDNGTTLTAPNGIPIQYGFRAYILSHQWDPQNGPLEAEYHADPVQYHNVALGAGQRQCFRDGLLWWTQEKGVIYEPYMGLEVNVCYQKIAALQAAIDGLKNTPPTPPPVPPDIHATIQNAIAILQKLL